MDDRYNFTLFDDFFLTQHFLQRILQILIRDVDVVQLL